MKLSFKIYIYIIALLALPVFVNAQFYNTGQAPASVKWKQIKTDNFQIIYPSGFYLEANRAANLLEHLYEHSSADYSKRPKKISVILYNQSVYSNGYVVWAPKRSEWVTTPPQNTYVQNWIEQLALHEYRHVVQLDNLEQGLTKVLKIIFGEMATGLVAAYLPFWYLEGDAVANETALSSTGRGRTPDFTLELRAIELEKEKRYSYDQSYLGSYRHLVPNHYKYGYQMVSYAKLNHDVNFWSKTIDQVGRRPYLGAPFYLGLKKNGAKSKVDLYHETLDSLKSLWKTETAGLSYPLPEHFNIPKTKHFTNYRFVQETPYGIFAVRTSIDDITRFVFLKGSSDSIIHTPGRYLNTNVSAGEKYVVWEEYLPDVRWQQKSYSVIKLLELATGKEKQLTQKNRCFAPSLSLSDDKIACVKINEQNQYSIIILDSFNGETENEIVFPTGVQVFHPVWMDEETLAYISMHNNGKCIEQLSINSRKRKVLFQSGLTNINCLYARDSVLYFSYDLEMARNIYALILKSNKVYKITSSKYGADYPFAKGNFMYYSDYSLNGYVPVKINLSSSKRQDINTMDKYTYSWAESLSKKSGTNIQKDTFALALYDSMKYNRLSHSFNLHSWTPFYFDIEDFLSMNPELYPGITLLSQNKLSTVTSSFSYYYKDQTHYIRPKITIERFYPVFELSVLFANRSSYYNTYDGLEFPGNSSKFRTFSIRSYLPLNLTENKYNRYFQPGISYHYTHEYYLTDTLNYKLGYDYFTVSLYLSNLLKKSPKDIYSRVGQTLYLATSNPLQDKESFASAKLGVCNLYLPGLFPHHSIRFYISGESKDIKFFTRNNSLSLPKGYLNSLRYSKMLRGSAEYTFPLFYPDWSVGPLAYIKRFYISVFYDAAKVEYLTVNQSNNAIIKNDKTIVSTGITLASEMHFLRFFVPFTPRITAAYLPYENEITITYGISIETSIF